MLSSIRQQLITRVITDHNGQRFNVTFQVYSVNGELKGRVVSIVPVASYPSLQGDIYPEEGSNFLPICCENRIFEPVFSYGFKPVVSPYSELYFFTSQPTRAPSIF